MTSFANVTSQKWLTCSGGWHVKSVFRPTQQIGPSVSWSNLVPRLSWGSSSAEQQQRGGRWSSPVACGVALPGVRISGISCSHGPTGGGQAVAPQCRLCMWFAEGLSRLIDPLAPSFTGLQVLPHHPPSGTLSPHSSLSPPVFCFGFLSDILIPNPTTIPSHTYTQPWRNS